MYKVLTNGALFAAVSAIRQSPPDQLQAEAASNDLTTAGVQGGISQVDSIDPEVLGKDLTINGLTEEIITNLVADSNITNDNQKLYVEVLQNHVKQIVLNKFDQLNEDDPLLTFCENAVECVEKVRAELTATITAEWQKSWNAIADYVKAAKTNTESEMTDAWAKMHQCSVDFPCCTFGDEYQQNVKVMIIQGKASAYGYYNNWYDLETKRLTVVDECPPPESTIAQTCAEQNRCWDGSARQDDWPSCSCNEWSNDVWRCPTRDCPDGTTRNENTCECECKILCAEDREVDAQTCTCVPKATDFLPPANNEGSEQPAE